MEKLIAFYLLVGFLLACWEFISSKKRGRWADISSFFAWLFGWIIMLLINRNDEDDQDNHRGPGFSGI